MLTRAFLQPETSRNRGRNGIASGRLTASSRQEQQNKSPHPKGLLRPRVPALRLQTCCNQQSALVYAVEFQYN
jgi:hypothetical protein